MSLQFRDNRSGYIRWARNRRRRLSSAFSPLDLPGLLAWWDPSAPGAITTGAGGVAQLDDASGNGEHVTQTTTSRQPTETTWNGLTAISYNDPSPADEQLNNATIAVGSTFTVFFACRPRTDASFTRFPCGNGVNSGTDNGFRIFWDTNERITLQISNGVNAPSVNTANGVFVDQDSLVIVAYVDGSNMVLRVNGSEVSQATTHDPSRTGNFACGASFAGSTQGEVKGILGDMGICGVLTAGEIASLEGYLANKWGAVLA